MEWIIRAGDILDEPADTLICSANGFLDLSGGVGAAIRMKYGNAMQGEMHRIRSARGSGPLPRGEIAVVGGCGTPFTNVIHAVAVDIFYRSDSGVITAIVDKALAEAAKLGARRVALVALATGYGPLSMTDFGQGVLPLREKSYGDIERVTIVVRKSDDAAEMALAMPGSPAG